MPLRYNQTLCHFNAFICIFSSEVCLHHRQFSSDSRLPYTRLLQGLEGFPTGSALPGPKVRQPSVAVYVRLFNHLMVSRMRLAVPSRALGLFVPFPRNHCPTQLQVSLPAQLWVSVLPADSQPTGPQLPFASLWCWSSCPTHHILCIHIHIML